MSMTKNESCVRFVVAKIIITVRLINISVNDLQRFDNIQSNEEKEK